MQGLCINLPYKFIFSVCWCLCTSSSSILLRLRSSICQNRGLYGCLRNGVITTAQLYLTKPEIRLWAGSTPSCGV